MVWLTWLGLPLLAVAAGWRAGVAVGVVVLAVGILAQIVYIRWFPRLSRVMGYGSVMDTPAPVNIPVTPLPRVTLYSASACPFCPIIRRRLAELQRQAPFEIEEVDVTFRPELVRSKGLRSVPVLEANGRLLVGNATSAQILEFLRGPGDHRTADVRG